MKHQTSPVVLRRVTGFALRIAVIGLLSSPTFAAQESGSSDVVIFDGSNSAPWRMYVGSNSNWMVPVEGPETTTYKSNVVTVRTADHTERDDAYQAEWQGGLGQVYFQELEPWDLTALAAEGGALSMVIRIDRQPKKSVDLKMDCGYPCAGTLNMTKLFKAVPQNQWFRASFKLSCFKDAGANLGHIVAPMVIATKGSFEMSISDVRLLTDPPPESLVGCG